MVILDGLSRHKIKYGFDRHNFIRRHSRPATLAWCSKAVSRKSDASVSEEPVDAAGAHVGTLPHLASIFRSAAAAAQRDQSSRPRCQRPVRCNTATSLDVPPHAPTKCQSTSAHLNGSPLTMWSRDNRLFLCCPPHNLSRVRVFISKI